MTYVCLLWKETNNVYKYCRVFHIMHYRNPSNQHCCPLAGGSVCDHHHSSYNGSICREKVRTTNSMVNLISYTNRNMISQLTKPKCHSNQRLASCAVYSYILIPFQVLVLIVILVFFRNKPHNILKWRYTVGHSPNSSTVMSLINPSYQSTPRGNWVFVNTRSIN